MKSLIALIYSLIIFGSAFAADAPEITSDQELATKFVSVIQASKIEDQVVNSGEFKKCAEMNKFDPEKSRNDQILSEQAAAPIVNCFKEQLKNKQGDSLKKLSEELNLKGFQLIRSQNVQEITNALSNRLYKKMTGIDLDEKDVATKLKAMKFSNANRKQVDQRDFVELYRVQLGKSALYEISRFCFSNLRRISSGGNTFLEHWGNRPADNIPPGTSISGITDTGDPEFGDLTDAGTDKKGIYDSIKKSFSPNRDLNANDTKNFFVNCMAKITPLCASFREQVATDAANERNAPPTPTPTQTGPVTNTAPQARPGANACLTQSRLQEIRKAMNNTNIVLEDFDKIGKSTSTIDIKNMPTTYNPQDRDSGYNSLSTITSNDFLTETTSNEQKLQDCTAEAGQEVSEKDCEGFVIKDDSYKKALHDTDMNLRLRTELEIATIQKLNTQDLETYLKEKGYFELLEAKNDPKKNFDEELKKFFEAQRVAALDSIKSKVGVRQLDSNDSDTTNTQKAIKANVEASKSEKARLAQVVLFTNIVTSNLELKRTDGSGKTKVIGKNTLGLNKEKENNSGIDGSFFSNLSGGSDDEKESSGTDDYLKDIQFLDEVIGAKPATTTANGN